MAQMPGGPQNLEDHFPDASIHRRNTGYAIDLIGNDPDALLAVLCGSEGTLGITTKIRVALDPLPPAHVAVAALHYQSMDDAMGATPKLMAHTALPARAHGPHHLRMYA